MHTPKVVFCLWGGKIYWAGYIHTPFILLRDSGVFCTYSPIFIKIAVFKLRFSVLHVPQAQRMRWRTQPDHRSVGDPGGMIFLTLC